MLRVTVEVLPGGRDIPRKIAVLHIAQAALHGQERFGDYEYLLQEDASEYAPGSEVRGVVLGHERHQSVWRLVQAVLEKALGKR